MNTQRRVFPESVKREAVDCVSASGLSAGAVAREIDQYRFNHKTDLTPVEPLM
jgi:transposase-like protein